jgi:hypothetical protein
VLNGRKDAPALVCFTPSRKNQEKQDAKSCPPVNGIQALTDKKVQGSIVQGSIVQ